MSTYGGCASISHTSQALICGQRRLKYRSTINLASGSRNLTSHSQSHSHSQYKCSENCEWETINYCERRAHIKSKHKARFGPAGAYDECGPNDLQTEHGQLWNALVPALVNWSCGLNGSLNQLGPEIGKNTQQWRMPSGYHTII